MVGTLLAFGVAPDLALSAVFTYRVVAIWIPRSAWARRARRAQGAGRPLGP